MSCKTFLNKGRGSVKVFMALWLENPWFFINNQSNSHAGTKKVRKVTMLRKLWTILIKFDKIRLS